MGPKGGSGSKSQACTDRFQTLPPELLQRIVLEAAGYVGSLGWHCLRLVCKALNQAADAQVAAVSLCAPVAGHLARFSSLRALQIPVKHDLSPKQYKANMQLLAPVLEQAANCSSLCEIQLQHHKALLPAFCKLTQITSLSYTITDACLTARDVMSLQPAWQQLQRLTLSMPVGIPSGAHTSAFSTVLGDLPSLEVLHIEWGHHNRPVPQLWAACTHLTELGLSGECVVPSKPKFGHLQRLRKLVIVENKCNTHLAKCEALPDSLEYVQWQFCELAQLPACVLQLPRLTELNCSGSSMLELPEDISSCSALITLRLGDNERSFAEFPRCIFACTALRCLELPCFYFMEQLPDDITRLQQLTALFAHGATFDTLPDALTALSQLQVLDVSECGLQSLPPIFAGWSSLVELNISCNALEELPPFNQHITSLDISVNDLREFPTDLLMLTQLQQLYISDNPFEEVLQGINALTSLTCLEAQYIGAVAVPGALSELVHLQLLDLSHNMLRGFPAQVIALTALTTLRLNDNSSVSKLPRNITRLASLRELNVDNTSLTSVPASITKLTALGVLTMNGTELKRVPPFLLSGMPVLRCLMLPARLHSTKLDALVTSSKFWHAEVAYDLSETIMQQVLRCKPKPGPLEVMWTWVNNDYAG